MSNTATQNDIVRLKTPAVVARTGWPDALRVTVNGQSYQLPWGADFRLSGYTDPDNKVGNMDAAGGYRLLHTDFYNKHTSQFEIVKTHED